MSENPRENQPELPGDPGQDDLLPDASLNEPATAEPDAGETLAAEEPPVEPEDTKPQAVPATVGVLQRLAADEPTVDPFMDTTPREAYGPPAAPMRLLLVAVVMAGAVCMCIALIGFAGFAGYRDGLATNDARITQTMATGIAQQYAAGRMDLDNGFAELAAARFEWIVETVQAPTRYALDSRERLATARAMMSATPAPQTPDTPTPTPTPTPPPTSPEPATGESTPQAEITAGASEGPDPATMFERAAAAMRFDRYEEAISWLEPLMVLAPEALDATQQAEVKAMYLEALVEQGRIYLRGQNQDGEDRLQRGVNLIYRADSIGDVEPASLLYEADFAQRYLNARSYVNGGNFAAALPVLERLCEENCSWAYQGVSVQTLLLQAQSGASAPAQAPQ
jgi:tetratricopeptide (TPR) repeat protein